MGTSEGSAPQRASNGIHHLLPTTLGGFHGQVPHAFGEQASDVGHGSLRDSAALRRGCRAGALNVALDHGRIRGGTTATGVDHEAPNAGASCDLGWITPMAIFATERGDG